MGQVRYAVARYFKVSSPLFVIAALVETMLIGMMK